MILFVFMKLNLNQKLKNFFLLLLNFFFFLTLKGNRKFNLVLY